MTVWRTAALVCTLSLPASAKDFVYEPKVGSFAVTLPFKYTGGVRIHERVAFAVGTQDVDAVAKAGYRTIEEVAKGIARKELKSAWVAPFKRLRAAKIESSTTPIKVKNIKGYSATITVGLADGKANQRSTKTYYIFKHGKHWILLSVAGPGDAIAKPMVKAFFQSLRLK